MLVWGKPHLKQKGDDIKMNAYLKFAGLVVFGFVIPLFWIGAMIMVAKRVWKRL